MFTIAFEAEITMTRKNQVMRIPRNKGFSVHVVTFPLSSSLQRVKC